MTTRKLQINKAEDMRLYVGDIESVKQALLTVKAISKRKDIDKEYTASAIIRSIKSALEQADGYNQTGLYDYVTQDSNFLELDKRANEIEEEILDEDVITNESDNIYLKNAILRLTAKLLVAKRDELVSEVKLQLKLYLDGTNLTKIPSFRVSNDMKI